MAYKQYELNSSSLVEFLKSEKVWFRLHEYEEDVKTAVKARKQVPLEKIVLVFVSNNEPFVVILQASKKASIKKIKEVLKVKFPSYNPEVRLVSYQQLPSITKNQLKLCSSVLELIGLWRYQVRRILQDMLE